MRGERNKTGGARNKTGGREQEVERNEVGEGRCRMGEISKAGGEIHNTCVKKHFLEKEIILHLSDDRQDADDCNECSHFLRIKSHHLERHR